MTTKEVAEICGVSIPTVTGNAKKVGIVLENGKAHEWTEEELKKVQAQLMKNQANQGTQTEIVKNEALNRFKAGLSLTNTYTYSPIANTFARNFQFKTNINNNTMKTNRKHIWMILSLLLALSVLHPCQSYSQDFQHISLSKEEVETIKTTVQEQHKAIENQRLIIQSLNNSLKTQSKSYRKKTMVALTIAIPISFAAGLTTGIILMCNR